MNFRCLLKVSHRDLPPFYELREAREETILIDDQIAAAVDRDYACPTTLHRPMRAHHFRLENGELRGYATPVIPFSDGEISHVAPAPAWPRNLSQRSQVGDHTLRLGDCVVGTRVLVPHAARHFLVPAIVVVDASEVALADGRTLPRSTRAARLLTSDRLPATAVHIADTGIAWSRDEETGKPTMLGKLAQRVQSLGDIVPSEQALYVERDGHRWEQVQLA